MDAYIDFANFCSFLKCQSNSSFKECNNVLKQGFNLYFTFDISRIDKADKRTRSCYESWESEFAAGRMGHKITWNVKRPSPEEVFCCSWEDAQNTEHVSKLMALYLIDINAEERDRYSNLLVSLPGEELSRIQSLKIGNAFKAVYPIDTDDLNDWAVFSSEVKNCTDIIIADQHLFWVRENVYIENVCTIFHEIISAQNVQNVNIVMFAFEDQPENPVPYNRVINSLKEQLKEKGISGVHITYVIMPHREEHDRSLITNYKTFTPHFSFNLFENGEKRTSGRYFDMRSHFDSKVFKMANRLIEDLQAIVNIRKSQPGGIWGDCKSNILNFG